MRRRLAVAASEALLALSLLALAPTEGRADMACASHAEWDQVELTMGVVQVRDIVGGLGDEGPVQTSGPHQGQYKVDWPACWDSTKKCRGWFNGATDILVDKNVIDR